MGDYGFEGAGEFGGQDTSFNCGQRPDPKPWERHKSDVRILKTYEAMVFGLELDSYAIEFADADGKMVEAFLGQSKFKDFPYPIQQGTYFGIVLYHSREKGLAVEAWPIPKYWHPTLREE